MYEDNNQYRNYYQNYNAAPYRQDPEPAKVEPFTEMPDKPEKPKKRVKKGASKILKKAAGVVIGGIAFGLCAALVMVIVLKGFSVEIGGTGTAETEAAQIAEANTADVELLPTKETEKITTVVTDVTDVVAEVMPAVVSITGMYEVSGDLWGFRTQSEQPGSASGIIVGQSEEELLVVTNKHVVEDAVSLSVQFIDDTSVDALVKGKSANEDLAVIAIDLADIPEDTLSKIIVATLGDSDTLKVGEPAIAIGNALGYGQSVTAGVISAVDREQALDDYTTYLIQTDAAINLGNSGGALLNVKGEVIGINANKIAGSSVEGMGYAIPISTAKPIIEELMTKETREPVEEELRAYLGISGVDVTADVQERYGLPQGVYISQVYENTAAAKAGLIKGDIIIGFDGETIETWEELQELLSYYSSGDSINITIMQGSPDGYQEKEIAVTLGGITE